MIQLDIISILLALEVFIVLFAGCIVLWFKFQKEKNKEPRVVLKKEQGSPLAGASLDASYDDCLRSELKQLQDMISGLPENSASDVLNMRGLLEVRQEFIALELSAQDWLSEPDTHQDKLAEGIRALMTRFVVTPDAEQGDAAAQDDEEKVGGSEQYEDQLEYFKSVIDNQLNVMRDLREKLAAAEDSDEGLPDEVKDLINQLEQAEKQAVELGRCVEILEEENERLRQDAGAQKDAGAVGSENPSNDEMMEDIGGMEAMVSTQQETIGKLKGLLADLALEAAQAEELETLMEHIQRANKELSGCIMVLEDENTMLRGEMERLRNNLSTMLLANNEAGDDAELQYKNESLSKKLEGLKSMIDIKDTTIGELQQKVEALKSEYMTATGKMPDIGEDE